MEGKAETLKCCCHPAIDVIDEGGSVVKDSLQRFWIKIVLSMILAGQSMVFGLAINMSPPIYGTPIYFLLHGGLLGISLIVAFLLGGPLFKETLSSVRSLKVTVEGMFVLSASGALISSLVASVTGQGSVYYEVVAIVMIIYAIGKTLGMQSRQKVETEISKARNQFNTVYVLGLNGKKITKDISEVKVGDCIVVDPGEGISVDGEIISGEGFVKETVINGELEPALKKFGDKVYAGSYAIDGSLEIRSLKSYGERAFDGVLKAIEEARMRPSSLQMRADQIMQWFLPLVVIAALGTFLYWTIRVDWIEGLLNSMSILLVACPCALGLATPIAVWGGLWKLSSMGLVVRTGRFMDALVKVDRIIFDKTGTLSEEDLRLVDFNVLPDCGVDGEQLKEMVQFVQGRVNHPIARAFYKLTSTSNDRYRLHDSKIVPGQGVVAKVEVENGKLYHLKLGTLSLMDVEFEELNVEAKKIIYVSCNDRAAAIGILEERIRDSSGEAIRKLKERGVKISILSGDPEPRVKEIGDIKIECNLSAGEKISKVRDFMSKGETLIYVGDGINDAGAMALCNGSIAMGGGAALTCSAASSVFSGHDINILPKAIEFARRVDSKIKGNMLFALFYNTLGIGFAAMGKLHPVIAALIMLASSAVVSIRSLRSVKG